MTFLHTASNIRAMSNSKTEFLGPSADALARAHTAQAIGVLVDLMDDPKPAVRMEAAKAVLDRGHGRAVQAVIAVPARKAAAAVLATMSESALLAAIGRAQELKGAEFAEPAPDQAPAATERPTPARPPAAKRLPFKLDAGTVTDAETEPNPWE